MNPTEIEFAVRDLITKPYDPETFPYELIGIYKASKVTIGRLKTGQTNAAKQPGDVLWRKKFFFRRAGVGADVGAIGDALAADPLTKKHKPRFILVTNGEQVHVRDLQLDDTLNVEYAQLDEKSDFLLPLAGFERRAIVEEHPADIKAAKKLKKLYDALLTANPTWNTGHHTHELNLLITRLLFCFYAEKTGIFDTPKIFTNTVTQHTSEDGSDVAPFLDSLFRIMNVEESKRPKTMPAVEAKFPYVNGSLFEDTVEIPVFGRTARRQMLECGDLDWTTINPDIFGSMIQTIAQDGTRSDLGMHYTSIPNIMKVLQPLFLDDLNEAYKKGQESVPKLEALLGRLSKIRVLDPACGSGNFLIIAYKELRKLEIQTLNRISELAPQTALQLSGISIRNFYGIDMVDFACETAKLSIWIAEHQMNTAFKEVFGADKPTLPLGKITTIRRDNALSFDWLEICPPNESTETYICGNPPYIGSSKQTESQKQDVDALLGTRLKGYRILDYVACWFVKTSDYIFTSPTTVGAFVTTSSICQGEQVPSLWPYIFSKNICVRFAHTPFSWSNSAANNAGIMCVVVGLATKTEDAKRLVTPTHESSVANINAYLVPSYGDLVVRKSDSPLNNLPLATKGSQPSGLELILTPTEKAAIVKMNPNASKFIKSFVGAEDFLYSLDRYALWINDSDLSEALSVPQIADRINRLRRIREHGGINSRRTAQTSHRFSLVTYKNAPSLVIPETTSERRQWLQLGLLPAGVVAGNSLYAVYYPPNYLLALLSSRLHRLWTQTVGGKLTERLRYSPSLVYNTFPIPALSEEQTRVIEEHSKSILKARAKHPGQPIAELYNPESMPESLREAHEENDAYIEAYIYGRDFRDDTHRLAHLFSMYSRMKKPDDLKGTLFGDIMSEASSK